MKKLLPLFIVTVVVLLMFAGVAGAVVREEPVEVEEGMMAITSVMDEPVEQVVLEGSLDDVKRNLEGSEEVVGEGIEGEVVITTVGEGQPVEESLPYDPKIAESSITPTKSARDYLPHAGIGLAVLLALAVVVRSRKSVPAAR